MPASFTQVQAGPQCTGSGTVALTTAKSGASFVPSTAGNILLATVLAPSPLTPFTPPSPAWQLLATSACGGAGRIETWMLPGTAQPGGLTSVSFSLPAAQSGVNCRGGLVELSLPAGCFPVVETVSVNSGWGPSFVGATTLTNGYNAPENSGRLTLADYVNSQASSIDKGTTLAAPVALHMQKWFLGSGTSQEAGQQYILNGNPSTTGNPNGMPGGLSDLINAGCSILLCVKPSVSLNGAASQTGDYGHLITTVNVIQAAMAAAQAANGWAQPPVLWVTVWQEPNGGSFTGTPAFYQEYYNYYAPAVYAADAAAGRAPGYTPVGIDYATNHSTNGNYQAYYPGDEWVGFVIADFYGNTYINTPHYYLDQPNGQSTVSMMDLADNHQPYPVPFGVGELGMSQQGVTNYPTQAQFYTPNWTGPGLKPWMNYVGDLFAARLADGKTNACVNWFSGANDPEYNILPDGEVAVTSGGKTTITTAYDLLPGINYIFAQCSKYAGAVSGQTTIPIKAAAANGAGSLGVLAVANFFAAAVPSAAWTVPAGYTAAQQLHNGSPNTWMTAVAADLAAGTQSLEAGFSAVTGENGWAGVLVTLAVSQLAVETTKLPNVKTGDAYSQALAAEQGTLPYSWAVTSGALPSGLALNPATGTISGTAAGSGEASFTVTVTDANGLTASQPLTITVTATQPVITTTALPAGTAGDAYAPPALAATSGTAPYSWAVTAGTLPPGLALNPASGAITGTPTTPGAYPADFTVTDANGSTATAPLTIVIAPAPGPEGGMAELQVLIGSQWQYPQPMSVQAGTWQPATIHTPESGAWN